MPLRRLIALYWKTQFMSWLTENNLAVYVNTPAGEVILARFRKGRYFEEPKPEGNFPDYPPSEWNQQ